MIPVIKAVKMQRCQQFLKWDGISPIRASSAEPSRECAICHAVRRKLNRDHSHRTGLDRGYLCRRCNLGLGWIEKALSSGDSDCAFQALKKWFRKPHRQAVLKYLERFPRLSGGNQYRMRYE